MYTENRRESRNMPRAPSSFRSLPEEGTKHTAKQRQEKSEGKQGILENDKKKVERASRHYVEYSDKDKSYGMLMLAYLSTVLWVV